MKKLLLILPILLVSCATVESVSKYTDMELCFALDPSRNVSTQSGKEIIRAEIKKRGIECKAFNYALDGKGLICRDNVKASIFNQQVWGVTFDRGYVQISDIEIKNDKVVHVVGEDRKYSTNLTEVEIKNIKFHDLKGNTNSIRFVLDRRTLELKVLGKHLTSIHNKQCEAFEDIDIQREKMQEIVDEKQKVADKILEENQI